MDALAVAIAKKRKSTQDEFKGRKFVKRSELEEARMRKLREEEAEELQKRVGGDAATLDAWLPAATCRGAPPNSLLCLMQSMHQ